MKATSLFQILTFQLLALTVFAGGGAPDQRMPKGEWVAEIPGVGKVALDIGSHQPNLCELFWIFKSVYLPIQRKGDVLILGSATNDVNSLYLSYDGTGKLSFHQGGSIRECYWAEYKGITFQKITGGGFSDITDFRRSGNEYEKFNKEGVLQKLPQAFPGWIMNVATYLFMNDSHTLPALLSHPTLEPETLSFFAEYLSRKEHSDRQLATIAMHTNTPLNTLKFLFEIPSAPLVWHSVSRNPRAPYEMKDEYQAKVKNGDRAVFWKTVRDRDCPPELLVWLYEHAEEHSLHNEIIRHPNTPAQLLRKIFVNKPYDLIRNALASNPSLPDDLMLTVIQTADKQTLWAAQKNPSISSLALSNVLHRLATSSEVSVRDSALLDNRIGPSVVTILMKEVDQRNRMILARNSALTFENLVTLADDPYRVVSAEAREYLRLRFPEQAKRILTSLPDLEQLNPASNKIDELLIAVKKRDLPTIDVCGKYFSSHDVLQPPQTTLFGEALRTEDTAVMTAVLQHFNSFQPSILIKDDAMNRQWFDFFHNRGIFEKDPFSILSSCIENNKLDALDYLLIKGLDVNARDKEGRTLLMHALKLRSIKIVEALLSRGADPAIADNMGLRAVDYAAMSYLISIVKKLDTTDKYRDMVKAFSHAFPGEKGSPLLGTWSNKQTGFSYSALFLSDDGTGILNTGIMPILVAWRSIGGSKIELVLFSNNGPDPKQKITFQCHISEKMLAIIDEKGKEGESKYYKVTQ